MTAFQARAPDDAAEPDLTATRGCARVGGSAAASARVWRRVAAAAARGHGREEEAAAAAGGGGRWVEVGAGGGEAAERRMRWRWPFISLRGGRSFELALLRLLSRAGVDFFWRMKLGPNSAQIWPK